MINAFSNKTTFWKFLCDNIIRIPIIQRDYAQGRIGKEELRQSFLLSLKNVLDNDSNELILDFVYGCKETDSINPLDGQQRITTLWLFHWYIAYKAGLINKENSEIFCRFTYETRASSRDFCRKLSVFSQPISNNDISIADCIQNQTWFLSAWRQDTTIQAMLRMLSGTEKKNSNNENIIDGLEELFSKNTKQDFICYWNKLIDTTKCNIFFYYLDLVGLNLSDDLYIKMNARGEQLSSFDNFKADFIEFIKKQDLESMFLSKLLDPKDGIPILLDTNWTDIFWENRSINNQIDQIYFAFINRFFLNSLIVQKANTKKDQYEYTSDSLRDNESFTFFYGTASDDSKIKYQSFKYYKSCIDNNYEIIDSLRKTLNKYFEVREMTPNSFFYPHWNNNQSFSYIPIYNDINNTECKSITQSQRVIFYAISKYLENEAYDKISLKQWMRVVWNLVENANIDNVPSMIGNIRLIDELSKGAGSIYKFLLEKTDIENYANKDQLEEEIEKARKILNPDGSLRKYDGLIDRFKGLSWEEVIIEAESTTFFNGSIRFLYRNENYKQKVDWSNFDIKFKNCEEIFDKNGLKEQYKVSVTKALVLQCTIWNKQLYDKQIFNPNAETWKNILCSENWIPQVHLILSTNSSKIEELSQVSDLEDVNINKFIVPFLSKLPFKQIVEDYPESRFRWYERLGLYKPRGQDAIVFDWDKWNRNELLLQLLMQPSNKTIVDSKIDGFDFFRGWDIDFSYKDNKFKWFANGKIYIMDGFSRNLFYDVHNKKLDCSDLKKELEGLINESDKNLVNAGK